MRFAKVKIGNIGQVVTGKTPPTKSPELYGEVYPFITPTDISNDSCYAKPRRYISEEGRSAHRNAMLPPHTVCYTCIASIGKACLTTETSLTNQQINSIIVDHNSYDFKFIYYLLKHETPRITALASGVATPIINKSMFSEIELQVPPLSAQQKMAAILSAYDDLIENNLRRIKILEEMAQTVYQEWFVKFRFPGYQKVKTVDSPLGKIPQGWDITSLDEMCKYISRGISPQYKEDSDCRVINQRCIRNNRVELELARGNTKQVPPDKFVRFGDVLINSTGVGTLGRVAQMYRELKGYTVDSHVTIVRPVAGVNLDYFGSSIILLQPHFERLGTGATGQTELNRVSIGETKLITPPFPIQKEFGGIAYPLRSLAEILRLKNHTLRQTRDLLLPKLISGELDVSELDITVPEANA